MLREGCVRIEYSVQNLWSTFICLEQVGLAVSFLNMDRLLFLFISPCNAVPWQTSPCQMTAIQLKSMRNRLPCVPRLRSRPELLKLKHGLSVSEQFQLHCTHPSQVQKHIERQSCFTARLRWGSSGCRIREAGGLLNVLIYSWLISLMPSPPPLLVGEESVCNLVLRTFYRVNYIEKLINLTIFDNNLHFSKHLFYY